MAQNQPKTPEKVIKMECTDPSGNDPYKVTAIAVVMLGKQQPLDGEEVQFYRNGIPDGNPCRTRSDGRATHDFDLLPGGEGFLFEAVLVADPSKSYPRRITTPKKPSSEKGATTLLVNPVKNGNVITLIIRVIDAEGNGVPNKRLTIIENGEVIKLPPTNSDPCVDQDGEYQHTTTLLPDHITNIQVFVAGLGKEGFDRNFTGRK